VIFIINMSFRVIDNFLPKSKLIKITKEYKKLKKNSPVRWSEESYLKNIFLKEAAKIYSFSRFKGFEEWTQNNTQCNSHIDKDEGYFNRTGKLKFSICSVIFYIEIKDLKGGELILEKDTITPKTNRLVIFNPGIPHSVNSFKGIRRVLLINPWSYKPEIFNNENI
tara:strand:- start:53 stop:550 length:498 start_codon:yes stop_codon:yes gene_type:complete